MRLQCRKLICTTGLVIGLAASQTPPLPKSFEVASVRPHQGTTFRTGPLTVSGKLIRLQGYTLFGLILDAYHVRDYQLAISFKAEREDLVDTMCNVAAKVRAKAD